MAIKYVFKLTGKNKGQTMVLNNRYAFVNGELVISDQHTAGKLQKILCEFNGCTLEAINVSDGPTKTLTNPSLTKESTKGTKETSQTGAAKK